MKCAQNLALLALFCLVGDRNNRYGIAKLTGAELTGAKLTGVELTGDGSNMKKIDFWYEFASTYSYLAAMRVNEYAAKAGVDVVWRPFLLGPIFREQGWDNSPFNIYKNKGANMVRDIERIAASRGLAFHMPKDFPVNSLRAARLALLGLHEGWGEEFSKAVFLAEFAEQKDITSLDVLGDIITGIGLDAEQILPQLNRLEVKERLKSESQIAAAMGIYGAPSFVTDDGELFWGDDRLEHALDWAQKI